MKKKTWAIVLSVVLVLALAITGTFAWLTDRDSDVNVFTWGNVDITLNEDFEQGATLVPGKDIEKDVTVTNTGKSDAWVWVKIAMPAVLDNDDASKNVIHFNYKAESVADGLWNWKKDGAWNVAKDVEIDGVKYNVYTVLYDTILAPGATTAHSAMTKVYLDKAVDIDPDGNLHKVKSGIATAVGWNINTDGLPMIYVSAYATQAEGFATAAAAYDAYQTQWGDNGDEYAAPAGVVEVVNVDELQDALDAAVDGDIIAFLGDITGDVTVTQKPDVKITIDGRNNDFDGVMIVDGKSATYLTAGLTIKNANFVADSITEDACINLGDGTNNTRYTCNVTVDNCTFDVPGAVGVKSYTGGDKNLTIIDCTVTAQAHSLVQAKGVDGLLVKGCKVYSKNGLNFNNSDNVTVDNCTVDVRGYAVRFGESSGGVGAAETYLIKNSTLKSACDDGDAVIILRGTADYATLTIENTTIDGTIKITNTATGATVIQ